MCTVTYIPYSNNSYTLTSNRDESPERGNVTIQPENKSIYGVEIIAPLDQKANGTWLLTAGNGITLCILNGAFEKHKHNPPYSYSRGLIPFKYFDYESTNEFIEKIDLKGVEPFTLVICENGEKLSVLIWDEKEKNHQKLNPEKSHIWSSATLYDSDTKKYKENLFNEFLKTNKQPYNILDFHTIGMNNPIEPSIFIKREKVETVSTTIVNVFGDQTLLNYIDYLKNKSNKLILKRICINEC